MSLPRNWTRSTLGEVATYWNGRGFRENEWRNAGLPIIRIQNLNDPSARYNYSDIDHGERFRAKNGDLLVAWAASLGAHIWKGGDAWVNQHIFRCDPHPEIVSKDFLYYALKKSIDSLAGRTHGSGIVHVTRGVFESQEIPLPPRAEQDRIASALTKFFGRIDACRARLGRVPQLLKKFREAVLEAAVTGKLTEEWRGKSIATDWREARADEVCVKVQSGGTPKAGFAEEPGVPFLKVYNIVGQKIDFAYRPQYVSRDVHVGELRKSVTVPDDVLMNIVGPPLGKVAVVPKNSAEWNINQALTLFRAGPEVRPRWLFLVLSSGIPIRSILAETRGIVGQANISLSQCRGLVMLVPPLREQAEIVRRVDDLFALADSIERRYDSAVANVEKLTPAILAKAFRGELVPQDPNDEPATKLLERIRAQRADSAQEKGGKGKAKAAAGTGRRGRPPKVRNA
jgi:type I restriction enzyme, S subunit